MFHSIEEEKKFEKKKLPTFHTDLAICEDSKGLGNFVLFWYSKGNQGKSQKTYGFCVSVCFFFGKTFTAHGAMKLYF